MNFKKILSLGQKKKNNSIKIWEQKKYYKTKTSIEKGNLPCYTFINYEGIY